MRTVTVTPEGITRILDGERGPMVARMGTGGALLCGLAGELRAALEAHYMTRILREGAPLEAASAYIAADLMVLGAMAREGRLFGVGHPEAD